MAQGDGDTDTNTPITMLALSEIIEITNRSTFKLDMTGVVGLFGGDYAVDALETIHLYRGRRWAGWYNYPGVVDVAKTFGQMADSPFWDSVFPGPNRPPAVTFRLAGKPGPEYKGAYSGTKLTTGYLGYLIAAGCVNAPSRIPRLSKQDGSDARKTGSSASVTIVSLPPPEELATRQSQAGPGASTTKDNQQIIPITPKSSGLASLAIVPSLFSIAAFVFCLVAHDSLCASLILVGIFCSGLSSIVLGSTSLHIRAPVPSKAAPPGDGLMFPADGSIIILRGAEGDVNKVTKGEFELEYAKWVLAGGTCHIIGISSLFLMAQFLVQLLLIPRCTFFGQIMFLVSFVASGAYHLYVVSREREKVQREILCDKLAAQTEKWILGTRTQMAVFVCLALGESHADPMKSNPDAMLSCIIPNETAVWKYWRRKVVQELDYFWKSDPHSLRLYVPSIKAEPEDSADKADHAQFTSQDIKLLDDLIDDAWCVFSRFPKWRDEECTTGQKRSNSEDSLKAGLVPGCSPV